MSTERTDSSHFWATIFFFFFFFFSKLERNHKEDRHRDMSIESILGAHMVRLHTIIKIPLPIQRTLLLYTFWTLL